MAYHSPFRVLNLVASTTLLDKVELNLAKKKILAELMLSPTGQAMVGGHEMDKNEVLEWFEALKNTQNWEYHRAIFQDTVLLRTLIPIWDG